jgi:hypothetical protein
MLGCKSSPSRHFFCALYWHRWLFTRVFLKVMTQCRRQPIGCIHLCRHIFVGYLEIFFASIKATCSFDAAPFPVMLCLIFLGEYSETGKVSVQCSSQSNSLRSTQFEHRLHILYQRMEPLLPLHQVSI